KFTDSGPHSARPAPPPPIRPGTPVPPPPAKPSFAPPHRSPTSPGVAGLGDSLDDDILGGAPSGPATPEFSSSKADPYFKSVFDQFVSVKKSCGEPTSGLTYEKFAEKLVK